ncbi:hypothetical protein D9Q98_007974 [Chlorella vulgaris]|uniref:Uncharacterized protein n=1 Tax=Chlorella vulgaris TaxID=3077 RepID=A0A9D4THV6_CHLVU|nr:hypothetical protein D9Q98_007974 [Chlorella vulgaris]
MGANLSTPEKIARCAKNGDTDSLKALLTDLQRNDASFHANRARYLEVPDEQGNTPLTLAAARGYLSCIQLLLQVGANVHHANLKPDGGSALHEAVAHKHEAVVELLLRNGASPFVENCKGLTAMDIACSTKNVPLLRRLEQCAPFAGWLLVKVPVFGGFGATWQRRWVVISHRFPNPRAPRNSQLTHCVFLAYKTLANTAPSCRVWLDGARAREVYNPKAEARLQATVGSGPRVAQAGITLHRKHELPAGVYTTGGHQPGAPTPSQQQEGYTFYLRPDDGSPAAVRSLDTLVRTVNNRGFPVTAAGASAAPVPQSQQQQQQQPPPPIVGPLLSSLVGVGGSASAPGASWGAAPQPAGAEGMDLDEMMARRLQEEYDAEVARQVHEEEQQGGNPRPAAAASQQQPAAAPASVVPSAPAAASVAAAAGAAGPSTRPPDYLTGGGFYPQVHFVGDEPAVGGNPAYPAAAPLEAGAGGAGAVQPPLTTRVSAPRLGDDGWHTAVPALSPSRSSSESSKMAAAAAQAGPQAQAGKAPAGEGVDDSALCVICMSEPATAGVLHGQSVHRCLCRDCTQLLKDSKKELCPMCREPVEAYINIF